MGYNKRFLLDDQLELKDLYAEDPSATWQAQVGDDDIFPPDGWQGEEVFDDEDE